mgnify:CR=1 FL=1|jgi:hypothetical protein
MKKKGLFILLGLVCIAVVAGSGFLVVTRDKTGPEITVSEDRKITYEMGGDKKALLDGVKATDKKDGDVSDSLMVEGVRQNEDGSLEVTYSAVDHSNNVTKVTCKVETVTQQSQEEQQPEGEQIAEPSEAEQESAEHPEEGQEEQASEENTEQPEDNSDTEAAIAALPQGSPQLRLSTHHADLEVGSAFQYMDYIESITDDEDDTSTLYRQIRLVGEVDTSQAGEYEVSYYVTDSNHNESNVEKLTVTVHE